MKMNLEKLSACLVDYKKTLRSNTYDERYKWQVLRVFQENWDENAPDFAEMLERSLQPPNLNLWLNQNYFPRKMLISLAEHSPGIMAELFKNLFNESLPVEKRIADFRDGAEQLGKTAFSGKSVYQDSRAIFVYLGLRFPEKYPLYKFGMFKTFADAVDWSEPVRKGHDANRFRPVQNYLNLCAEVKKHLFEDPEILPLHRENLDPMVHFMGDASALLIQDFIYCTALAHAPKSVLETDGDEMEIEMENTAPRVWLFAAGDKSQRLQEFWEKGIMAINFHHKLGDLRVFSDKKAIGERLKVLEPSPTGGEKMNDQLACWEFVHVLNKGDIVIAKRGREAYLGWGIVGSEYRFEAENSDFQHVREVNWQKRGEWEADFKLVVKTLTDITKYPDYVHKLKKLLEIEPLDVEVPTDAPKNIWWLNANPKIWRIDQTPLGETQTYTSRSESGNKRVKYKHFEAVRPGDVIVGYETTPVKKVKALFEVEKGLHDDMAQGEIIRFRKVLQLAQPIDYERLKSIPALAGAEPLLNNQGSLFRLTTEEFEVVQAIIDEERTAAERIQKTVRDYSDADALADLFLSEDTFKKIKRGLLYKKNVILEGPPGVGKTFAARRIAKAVIGKDDDSKIHFVQFHQSYSYEDFLQGIRPDGLGQFKMQKGLFYRFVERAQRDPSPHFLIIDEINRGNLSKIFGELMLLLEADKRGEKHAIALAGSEPEETFFLPENLHLIGTMNTADRSLALVDFALRRRFAFFEIEPNFDGRFSQHLSQKGLPETFVTKLCKKISVLNEAIVGSPDLGAGFRLGHSYFCSPPVLADETAAENWLRDVVEFEIAPQLREYWFDDRKKADQLAADLLKN